MIDRGIRLSSKRFGSNAGRRGNPLRAMILPILLVGLSMAPLFDFLSVYALKGKVGGDIGARYSLFLRGGMVAALTATLLLGGRARLSNWQIGLMSLITILASFVSLAFADMAGSEFVEQVIAIAKIFSLFIYVAALSDLTGNKLERVEKFARMTLLVYALAIIAGALFSIDIFRSYRGDTQIRAGYKGIIYAQNEASALLLSGLALAFMGALRRGWQGKNVAFVVILIVAAFSLGTKGAVVAVFGVIAVYCYSKYGLVKASIRLAPIVVIVLMAVLAVYYLSASVRQAVDLSVQYFSFQSDRASGDKVATILLSGRNVKFSNVWDDLSDRYFVPLLTGGYPIVRYPIEMDGPDLALIMGIPVFSLYLYYLFKLYVRRGGGYIAIYGRYFFVLLMLMASSAGHVLTSAIAAPYLALIVKLVHWWSVDKRRQIAP